MKLLWDFYHMQLEDGDLIEKFTAGADQVAHVQIGDVPGRHQPGTGEVNHANLLRGGSRRRLSRQDRSGIHAAGSERCQSGQRHAGAWRELNAFVSE